jgi:hypothetical protein
VVAAATLVAVCALTALQLNFTRRLPVKGGWGSSVVISWSRAGCEPTSQRPDGCPAVWLDKECLVELQYDQSLIDRCWGNRRTAMVRLGLALSALLSFGGLGTLIGRLGARLFAPILPSGEGIAGPSPVPEPISELTSATWPKVFISYRRQDSEDITGRISDRLVARLPPDHVFKDVDSLSPGTNWRTGLLNAVSRCDVLLAVVGESWIDAADESGVRRLDQEDDWVRFEIETALKLGTPIIPLLVGGAAMPRKDQLPRTLTRLQDFQATELRGDPHFHQDFERLLRALEQYGTIRSASEKS